MVSLILLFLKKERARMLRKHLGEEEIEIFSYSMTNYFSQLAVNMKTKQDNMSFSNKKNPLK